MKIWVDADACPAMIKEIIFRAAIRRKIETILVANQWMHYPKSPYIKFQQVEKGLDVADQYIVDHMSKNELVITADIPLAAEVINNNGHALNPRGTFYDKENIGEILSMRNFKEDLRSSGQISGGPASLTNKDKQAFAAAFDRFLTSNRA